MNVAAAVREMVSKGLTTEQALIAIEVFEGQEKAKDEQRLTHKREVDRERQRRHRSRNVTPVTRDRRDKRDTPRALAFFIGEEVDKIPPDLPSVGRPPPGARGSRLAADFAVSPQNRAFGKAEGLTDHEIDDSLVEFANYWRALPGSKACKLDWDMTFENNLRKVAHRKKMEERHGRSKKRTMGDASQDLIRRVDEEYAERMRSAPSDPAGGEVVRLLPGIGGQRS